MTIETDPQSSAGSKASVAADEAQRVGSTAKEAGQSVAHEAATQASAVVEEAKDQFAHIVDQTKQEVRSQMDARAAQAANGLQTLSRQLTALKEGRLDEAGGVRDVLSDLERRVQRYSQSVQDRGPSALANDVTNFARRRPMAFLFVAGAAGFAVGRLVRAGAVSGQSSSSNGNGSSTYGMRRPMDGGLPSSYDPMADVREPLPDRPLGLSPADSGIADGPFPDGGRLGQP